MIYKFKILFLLVVIACIAGSCSIVNHLLNEPDDWEGEELFEDFLYKETGIDVDLTPSSLEVYSKDF